jgi:hypothetical protein
VKVVAAKSDNSPNLFADSVLNAFRKEFGRLPDASRKLIVRCERKDEREGAASRDVSKAPVTAHRRRRPSHISGVPLVL